MLARLSTGIGDPPMRIFLAGAIALALLHGCMRRDDGAGQLWKGVACIEKGSC